MQAVEVKKDNRYILYDADCIENPELLGFDADYWASQNAIMGFAEGRGTTFFIQHADGDYVLRHYRRGGMIARLSPDQYIWTGLRRTRAWREWHLLARMQEMWLPVPQPVAVQVVRHGMLYSADIMTRRINHANTLADELGRHALTGENWQELGKMIRRFHRHGIWHADLNANNVLLNNNKQIFLIDFDRGRLRQPAHQWQQANLERLKRSLLKLQNRADSFYFTASDWQTLLDGYLVEELG
ncbi:MAG: 3-deoxy-D-manno-octulosonic acid kinase [Gammaproteobacteria bacterium]|nr:3-deoxy-D-manno-octulosonic acid kinase [Gammaproteobacteria bacterium]